MVISDSTTTVPSGLGEQIPHPGTVQPLQVCISCFVSNLDPGESLSEDIYFPWDRSRAEPKGSLQRGVSGKGFGVAPSPWQDFSSAELREPIVAAPRHQGWAREDSPGSVDMG